MTQLMFLGSGSGLGDTRINFQSNLLLCRYESMLGIDCGTTFQQALEYHNINIQDIDGFYISHLHADHVGGLEWVGFSRYFSTYPFGQDIPKLFGNTEVLSDLWKQTLSGGMESLQGKRNTLDTYFDVNKIPPNGKFLWQDIMFDLVQTIHVVDDRRIKPSYGLLFTLNNTKIFFTGDTQFAPNQILAYYEQADIIFQDCEVAEYPGSVHAQYRELRTLPDKYKNKMWLYHNSNRNLPDFKSDGFLGFVERGQIFEF